LACKRVILPRQNEIYKFFGKITFICRSASVTQNVTSTKYTKNKEKINMADGKTRQLSPKQLQEDLDAYAGMQGITGYSPANAAFDGGNGKTLKEAMAAAQTKEVQDKAVWEASRDQKVADEWAFHDFIRNMRIQVKAQFGENSNEVAAVGLKKKNEYKNPTKKTPTP